jgi:hypothetical protein
MEEPHQFGVRRRLLAAGDRIHQRGQLVHDPGEQGNHAGAGGLKHLLGGVAQLGESGDPHHAAGAFQGVQLALDLDRRLGIGLHARHAGGEALQTVAGFLDEEGDEISELRVQGRPGVRSSSSRPR